MTMLNLAPRRTHPLERTANQVPTICVVDRTSDDYESWKEIGRAHGMRLNLIANADEALGFSDANGVDLWVISTKLPGLTGFELCSVLKRRSSSRVAICLMADEYSPEVERAAWAARATLFLCKGEHAGWLADWLHSRSRPSPQPVRLPTIVSRL